MARPPPPPRSDDDESSEEESWEATSDDSGEEEEDSEEEEDESDEEGSGEEEMELGSDEEAPAIQIAPGKVIAPPKFKETDLKDDRKREEILNGLETYYRHSAQQRNKNLEERLAALQEKEARKMSSSKRG